MKFQTKIFTGAAALLLLTTVAHAQITLTDIGSNAPSAGALDISQFSTNGSGTTPGLNYYWDDGIEHPTGPGWNGQSFTTGSSVNGYTVTSLAIKTLGNGGGQDLTNQSFTLSFYELSGASITNLTNATLINTFTATGALTNQGDWLLWTNLGVSLAPNTNYAYGFGITSVPAAGDDWEELSTASGWPYTGGQICLIVDAGGLVTYSTSNNTYDATFDLGLALPSAPIPAPPLETPSTANVAIGAGTPVTLVASSAGLTPLSFQWQTDGGTGQTPTNIVGSTGTNLVVNSTGWAPGTYVYDFVASNALGVVISPTIDIVIVPILMEDTGTTNAPTPGPNDISQFGYTPGAYNPAGFNYYTDNGAGHSAWSGQTFTTGSNSDGYILNSIAWKSDGNGNSFPVIQLYDLYIFSISNTDATLLTSFTGNGGGAELDWFKFVGLDVSLAPNTLYAYAFGRDSTATGWESIGSSSNNPGPYAGGQVVTIFPPSTGGTVTYGTGHQDSTFDIGLSLSTAPFTSEPTYTPDVTPVYAGTVLTLNEDAAGTPPLSLQWFADNGSSGATWTAVGGAIASNLVVSTTALTAGNYEYEVVVKNSSASVTSAPVTLDVVAASEPVIVTDTSPNPTNEDYVGESTSFSATFGGTLPIAYQWMVNTGSGFKAVSSVGNPSATNEMLVLANVQAVSAGTYYLSASNSIGGPVTSTPSTLTVLADPATPGAGSYGADILADGPLAYWPLYETADPSTGILPAYDASGHGLDGVYGQYSLDGVPGPASPDYPGFSGATALQTQNAGQNTFVTIPPLGFTSNSVTLTAWIDPTANQVADTGLIMSRNAANSDAAGLAFGGTENASGMPALTYYWNLGSAATYGFSSGLYPPINQWSFVALVITPADATLYLYYIDPITLQPNLYSAVNAVTNDVETFSPGTGGTNLIGADPYDGAGRAFGGDIDQVAVFNAALTPAEILAMFSKASGVASFAPSISSQPQAEGAYAGGAVTLAAGGIDGTTPFSYQWQYNGVNLTNGGDISGATNLSLTLTGVTSANQGTYDLLVKNSVSTTESSNAVVVVRIPVPGSFESAVLQLNPLAYWGLDETNGSPGTATAYDFVSGLNGVYQSASEYGFNGVEGPRPPAYPGFPSDDWALETFAGVANSYVTASAGTLVASNLTYVMWINPQAAVGNWSGLLMDRGGVGEGLGFGGVVNASGMSELAFTWNQNSTWTNFEAGTPPRLFPPTSEWSFVAMVIEPSQGTLYMFNTNGFQSSVDPIAMDAEEFGVAWHIGDDGGGTGGRTFPGMISGVGVFLSALSSNQVLSLYDVGIGKASTPPTVTLYIAKAGSGGLTLTWSAGTLVEATNLTGPWTTNTSATSPYPVTPTGSQMFFEVK